MNINNKKEEEENKEEENKKENDDDDEILLLKNTIENLNRQMSFIQKEANQEVEESQRKAMVLRDDDLAALQAAEKQAQLV